MAGDLFELLSILSKNAGRGWLLCVPLGKLAVQLAPHRVQEITQMLTALEKEKKYRLFLDDTDAFVLMPESKADDMRALVIKIKFIAGAASFQNADHFFTLYHLENDLKAATQSVQMRVGDILPEPKKMPPLVPIFQNYTQAMPFTPALLAGLERSLTHADLSSVIRRQPICTIVGKSPPMALFEEVYVSLSDLKKTLCPNVDFEKVPALFNRLLETLDKRVLENIMHHDGGAFQKNFSVNLTIKTVLGPDFDSFDACIQAQNKSSVVIELKLSDILADAASYQKAHDMIRSKGYRLAIDLVTLSTLPFVDLNKLKADYLKLIFDPKLMQKDIPFNQAERLILCRVDDAKAVPFAQKNGITMFQGYAIQKLFYKNPKSGKLN